MNKRQFQRLAGIEVKEQPLLGNQAKSKARQFIKESLSNLLEKDEEEIEDEDLDLEGGEGEEDLEVTPAEDPIEGIQSHLTNAQKLAATLGDEKLVDQIGNTITYFTRNHISKPQEGGMGGNMIGGEQF